MEQTAGAADVPRKRPALPLEVVRVYAVDERPEVLVEIGGDWQSGELFRWSRDLDGELWADVAYSRPLDQKFLSTFSRQRVWGDRDDIAPGA